MPAVTRSMCGGEKKREEPTPPAPATEPAVHNKPQSHAVLSASRKSSSKSKAIADVQERLARAKVELAEAELARLKAESDSEDNENDDSLANSEKVRSWLDAQPTTAEKLPASALVDLSALTAALTRKTPRPPQFAQELPTFSGNSGEWLAFKASYRDTKKYFTALENLYRLRRSLRDHAKESAEALFYGEQIEPEEIMKHLEVRFGRADSLVMAEVSKMKDLPKLTDVPRDTIIFASRVNTIVAVVKSLNKIHYLYNPETVRATIEKMTPTMRYRWYDYALQRNDEPDLITLANFLSREAELCAQYAQPELANNSLPAKKSHGHRSYAASAQEGRKPPPQANEIEAIENISQRWVEAKKLNLCFRCLHKRAFRHRCAYQPCGIANCKGSHHPLLHGEKSPLESERPAEESGIKTIPEIVTITRPNACEKAYLKVIPVRIHGPTGGIDTFALLDEGSTVTLVEDHVAQAVGATGPREPFKIEGVAGAQVRADTSMYVPLHITGKHSTKQHKVMARTITKLHLSPQTIDNALMDQCKHLRDISEHLQYQYGTPTLIIGQDNWHLIVTRDIKSGPQGQPVASLTELGWVLHGSCSKRKIQRSYVNKITVRNENEKRMDELIASFFDLDNIGVEPRHPQNDKNARALAMLQQRSRRLPDGSFETGLLWRDETIVLPSNREQALRRLENIEKKLEKDAHLKQQYHEQMNYLIEKGYAERAVNPPPPGKTWYLPHFPVCNANKNKPRIVLDAAARSQGISLNDCLLAGPDLLQSLPGVLMRFRQKEVAVIADIQEMFLRIRIRDIDRDAQRFLWRENRDGPPLEYRMASVIFGAASSPCTAIFIKNKNADDYKTQYPEAAEAISRNHYMDDYCQSFNTIEEAIKGAAGVNRIHQQAGFHLQKWASNRVEVTHAVAPNQSNVNAEKLYEKTLGLVWRPHEDRLAYNMKLKVPAEVLDGTRVPTKRVTLQTIMSLFDPLGLLTPVMMPAKRLMQEAWRLCVAWDDELPGELHAAWREWLGHVQRLQHLSIARCYPHYATAQHLEMHIFVDASESACVAAVYWRGATECATAHLSLAMAKGKVGPLKMTSIPRLELQAAVLGSRLARTVQDEHDVKPVRRVFWSDSRTVLAWLRAGPRVYKPFVAHRVAEIEEETKVGEWRWVPTALNVADDATRNTPSEFNHEHRWFRGPDFLYQPEELWPREPASPAPPPTGEERVAITRAVPRLNDALPEAIRFSSWLRLIRATGRVLHFIELCRNKRTIAAGRMKRTRLNKHDDHIWKATTNPPAAAGPRVPHSGTSSTAARRYIAIEGRHIERAERLWWSATQEESFGEDLRRLRKQLPVERDSPLRALSVYIDDEGTLRLKSRIDAAINLSVERRHPPILHGEHAYTRLHIAWVHKQNHHAGTETVVNEIRSRLWVLRLRPITRTIVRSCIACRILRAKPATPATGDHPITRLSHHQRAFTYVGLDYFGPQTVTVGRKHEKRYVALFTCMTTRAVHLEVAGSLDTDSAIMALRRMMSRRGCPKEIHSDNGTNLRGADVELQRAAREATKNEASSRAITWRYTPPGAPFMGGAWERLVQSVKRALAATLKERAPTEEVFSTLLLEAEYTVNNRPLTIVSTSPDDSEALTPLHFLLGGPARVPLPGSFTDKDLLLKNRWRHAQRLADVFWERWIKEYLPLLQDRRDPRSTGRGPQIGDVVLIVDETLPRNAWVKGRVEKLYPGKDVESGDTVRVVDVRTKNGVRKRPTKKLVVLTS